MKKSNQVPASLIIALAASLAAPGCGGSRQCQDSFGRVIPDTSCQSGGVGGAHWVPIQRSGFGSSSSGGFFGG